MDFKPQSFFIGVVDFFSVWIPGAIFTWFLKVQYYDPYTSVQQFLQLPQHPAAQVAIFLVVTYIAGSILFGISTLLDPLYDKRLRSLFMPKDRGRLQLELKTASIIKEKFIHSDGWIENLYGQEKLTKEQYQHCLKNPLSIINTYKWTQHYFLLKYPDALYDIKKVEADSKFFRSLVVTFFIMSITLFLISSLVPGTILLALSMLSLYLYSTNRYKSTIRAYELIITHYHQQPSAFKSIRGTTLSTSIQSTLEKEFRSANRALISSLSSGLTNSAMQVTINDGEWNESIFSAAADEQWYCVKGKGCMTVNNANGESRHFILPNAMIPLKKGTQFSLENLQKEPIEFLVINN